MYTVKNKAIQGLKNKEGKAIKWKSNFLNSAEDKANLLEIAQYLDISIPREKGKSRPDFLKLQKKVNKALEINWVAQETLKSSLTFDDRDIQKELASTTDINEFYETYASVNMGLHKLTPGSTAELVDDEEVIEQLIATGLGKYLTISYAGKKVYDGEVMPFEQKQEYLDGKEWKKKTVEVSRVINSLHPENENAMYFETKPSN
jgi:hypothetical protein